MVVSRLMGGPWCPIGRASRSTSVGTEFRLGFIFSKFRRAVIPFCVFLSSARSCQIPRAVPRAARHAKVAEYHSPQNFFTPWQKSQKFRTQIATRLSQFCNYHLKKKKYFRIHLESRRHSNAIKFKYIKKF